MPFPVTGNTILPEITLGAVGMSSGDQVVYTYYHGKDRAFNVGEIVALATR